MNEAETIESLPPSKQRIADIVEWIHASSVNQIARTMEGLEASLHIHKNNSLGYKELADLRKEKLEAVEQATNTLDLLGLHRMKMVGTSYQKGLVYKECADEIRKTLAGKGGVSE